MEEIEECQKFTWELLSQDEMGIRASPDISH